MPQTKLPLDGQTAIVTGANSGIGEAAARCLARAGSRVVVNYVARPEDADRVVAAIEKDGGRAVALRADVGDEAQVQEMFAEAIRVFGAIDILVSNAGIQKDAAYQEMTLDQWNAVLRVNLTGAFLCAREAVREFLRHGVRPDVSRAAGKIIFTSSVHQVIPWAGHANYAATKGGLMLLMQSVAQETASRHIRVNSVAPGAIKTPINRSAWATPEAEARLVRLIPYGRVGDPEDVGRVIAWLASDESDYVHGTTIFVDGGMTLYPGFSTGQG